VYAARKNLKAAEETLLEAFERTIEIDVFSLKMHTVCDLLLKITHVASELRSSADHKPDRTGDIKAQRALAPKLVGLCRVALEKLKKKSVADDGDAAVFYKTYAEQCILAGLWKETIVLLEEAIRIFKVLNEPLAAKLQNDCEMILSMVKNSTHSPLSNPAATASAPATELTPSQPPATVESITDSVSGLNLDHEKEITDVD